MTAVLRAIAVAIAVAAFVDPAVTLSGRTRPRLAVAVQNGPTLELPSTTGRYSRREVALGVVQQLTRDLRRSFEFVDVSDASAGAIVVVGDRYPVGVGPSAMPISTVSLVSPSAVVSPNVRIVRVDAPATVPAATAIRIEATLEGAGVGGSTTTAIVETGGFEVGRATHAWTSDRERWNVGLDVVPVGAAPFTFRLTAAPLPGERTPIDNSATVRVGLAPPMRIVVFDARPSWASAFLRRALEDDPRFEVRQFGRMSPTALVASGGTRSLADALGDAPDVLVLGGLDALTADDVSRSERFVRERGGALVLVPDGVAGLAPLRGPLSLPETREVLLERQAVLGTRPPLPQLDASELIAPVGLPNDAAVLAGTGANGNPVVWTAPLGAGRLLFSGATDAWRYRASNRDSKTSFDRFWRAVVAGLALGARPPIAMEVRPGQLFASLRDPLPSNARVAASTRLFPGAGTGEFFGALDSDTTSSKDELVVTVAGNGTSVEQRISPEPVVSGIVADADGPPLGLLAATQRGIDVPPERLGDLERFLRSSDTGRTTTTEGRPMRSTWWILPFVACLGGEWWLRRRRGLR